MPDWRDSVAQAREGSLEAFDLVVQRFKDMAVAYAYSLLGDFHLAEDAAQEAFIRAYLDLGSLRVPQAFPSWFRQIVFKHCDRLTRRKRLPTTPLDEEQGLPAPADDPAEAAARHDEQDQILGLVRSLPERERSVTALFYIDGYTCAEVGEFLDLPVSTVKNRLHAARGKLRERMVETMEETLKTLKQHRPTAGFDQRVKKVLEGIGRIHWRTTSPLCFVGSVVAALRHLGEQLEPDYVMGISGGAFKAFWIPPWSPANCDLLLAGEEPVRRTFGALGYGYTVIRDYDRLDPAHTKEFFRAPIVRSLDAGRPVLAIGVVGPPECCVVAGYEKGGDVLYGRSYFQPEAGGYFRSEDWYENIHGLILIGEKQGQPPQEEILRSTLEWAIELARRPEFPARLPLESGDSDRIVSGLAAYDAMAKALLDDAAFEPSDREGFTLRIVALGNDGLWLMWDSRDIAARFLRQVASWVAPAAVRQELLAAAEAYAREVAVLKKTTALYPCTCEFPVIQKLPENVRAVADPRLRREVSRLVLEARSIEEVAVEHLEKALAGLGS